MKLAIARAPGRYGGIFRRFRELCAYCEGRHSIVGLIPLAESEVTEDWPVRTHAYSRSLLSLSLLRAESTADLLQACEPLINRIAHDLRAEAPDHVIAVDSDIKGLCVIGAARRVNCPVTTIVAGVATEEALHTRQWSSRLAPLAEQYCLTQSGRLIFPSRLAAEVCAQRYPGMAPYTVIHNGIADGFLFAERRSPDPHRIGAVMRMSGVKNPEALGRIASDLAEHGFRVELVTDTSERVPARKLLSAVQFREPMLSTEAMAEFYTGCHAVVSPSRFETFGNVPLEAVAAGTPAVVTDRMGISELFRELGLDHLVVPVDDVSAAVHRLIHAEPIPASIREHLRLTRTWPAVCAQLINAL